MAVPRTLWQTFLNGLAVVVPVVLTGAVLYWFGASLERALGAALRVVLPEDRYFQGLGLLIGVGLVYLVGIATRLWLMRRILALGDWLLERTPLAKTIYGAARDLMRFVSTTSQPERMGKVVLVTLPGEVRLVGVLTEETPTVDVAGTAGDLVTVYLPMSYMVGGYTALVPRTSVEPLDLDFEDAMRWLLTAGVSSRRRRDEP